jgi:hypothetical protein
MGHDRATAHRDGDGRGARERGNALIHAARIGAATTHATVIGA